MSGRTIISTKDTDFAYGKEIPEMITAATKERSDKEFTKYLTQIGMTKEDFLISLKANNCNVNDFYTYLDALTLADENPLESLDDLIGQVNTMKIRGGGMRQVGGSVGLLALHIKIFKKPVGEVARLSLGASVLLLQNTIILLDSLPNCFMYFAKDFIKHVLDWMMNLCKDLYDNRDTIGQSVASGAITASSAVGPAVVATPGALLDILRGVDALGMRFAGWYNPPDNGLREIMDAVKQRNEEYHAEMGELAAEQAEAVGKKTAKTMELQDKKLVAQRKVASMNAIREASEAAGELHAQLTEETGRLDNEITMDAVRRGKGKVKAVKAVKASTKHLPRFPSYPGQGNAGAGNRGPSAGAGPMDQSDSDGKLGGGGKRATRKRSKRSSKRAPRKTKTTRRKRRGKK